MNTIKRILMVAAIMAVCFNGLSAATAKLGNPAPDFSLTDIEGKQHALSDYKGKTVVLEWFNAECPFVIKHYTQSGNIPRTQKAATEEGVVWLTINSAAPGKQGDYDAAKAKAWLASNQGAASAYLRDHEGKVGKLYDARTTPHLYVIDGQGVLVYAGAIDSIRSSRVDDIAKATNYVTETLADLKAGRPVRVASSKPYGCAVKY